MPVFFRFLFPNLHEIPEICLKKCKKVLQRKERQHKELLYRSTDTYFVQSSVGKTEPCEKEVEDNSYIFYVEEDVQADIPTWAMDMQNELKAISKPVLRHQRNKKLLLVKAKVMVGQCCSVIVLHLRF